VLVLCSQVNMMFVVLSVHPHRASWKVCLTTVGIEPATFGILVFYYAINYGIPKLNTSILLWTSIPKVAGSIPAVVRQIFQLARCECTLKVTPQTINIIKRSDCFCMLRNTRPKLMRIIYHLRLWLNSKFLFFDTFLNRQTNLKSMFSVLSVK
jgi:hypothetical protein